MKIGILAYGSLIGDPGWEIQDATTDITRDVQTPFNVEFARSSSTREGAPTLVPVEVGGGSVSAIIYRVGTSEQRAADMLYRREVHDVGSARINQEPPVGRTNAVRVVRLVDFAGYDVVLSTKMVASEEVV